MRQTLDKEVIDGEKARQLLNNEVFKAAWENAENSIISQMAEVKMRDTEMHTRLILALQILNNVRRHIETTMETGQLAEFSLKEPGKFARVFG
jgi:hypothetical protein